jgi:hypothetical protein
MKLLLRPLPQFVVLVLELYPGKRSKEKAHRRVVDSGLDRKRTDDDRLSSRYRPMLQAALSGFPLHYKSGDGAIRQIDLNRISSGFEHWFHLPVEIESCVLIRDSGTLYGDRREMSSSGIANPWLSRSR